jgi:hypothetical protein
MAKVLEGRGFVDSTHGRLISLWFDEIFDIFHLNMLHYTFVRLFSLSMVMQIIRDRNWAS